MGCVNGITATTFPKQSEDVGGRTEVCFHYDSAQRVGGTVVRDDREAPFVCIIKLDDGRYVLTTECQYTPPRPATTESEPPAKCGDLVCDALTEALVYVGRLADEACESPMLDLRDESAVRGLARLLTTRDSEGRDGALGEATAKLWRTIGSALAATPTEPSDRDEWTEQNTIPLHVAPPHEQEQK